MAIEISAALSGARAAVTMAKDALAARDDAKLKAALIDIQERLADALGSALDHAERSRALENRLQAAEAHARELERKAEERALYVLAQVGAGAFAYATNQESGTGYRGHHYLCQPCYDKGIKAVLRHVPGRAGFGGCYTCPESTQHTISELDP